MDDLMQLMENAPFRPVDWRWQKAKAFHEAGQRPPRRSSGPYLNKALDYLIAINDCCDRRGQLAVAQRFPELAQAFAMETNPQYAPDRYEIQARLLARQSPADIHKGSRSISAEIIDCYEKVLFNVTDRLDDQRYIIHQVFGERLHTSPSEREYDLFWKLMGYCGGPKAVDFIIMGWERAPIESKDQMAAYIADTSKGIRERQALISTAAYRPHNNFERATYLEMHARFKELEQQIDGGEAKDSILVNIKAMLGTLPWCTGSRAPDMLPHLKLIRQYSAIPRAHELMRMISEGPAAVLPVLDVPGFPQKVVKSTEQIAKTLTLENGEIIQGDCPAAEPGE